MQANHVYRAPPQYRSPQLYRQRAYEPYTLRWLFSRATQQYVVLDEPGGGWDAQSVPYGQSPAVIDGDILVAPLLTSPGSYAVTLNADGIVSADTGGDSSRQLLSIDIYDSSLAAFYGAATFAINDQAPIADPFEDVISLDEDEVMTSRDLAAQFSDPELDTLTYSVSSGSAPSGTSVDSAGQWTGTPTTVSTGTFTLTATDPYGRTGTLIVDWAVSNQIAVPDVDDPGTGEGDALALIALALLAGASVYAYSSSVPAGEVISQSPAPGALVDPGSTVTITVSLGEAALVEGGLGSRPRRRYYVEINGQRFNAQSLQHAQALLEQTKEITRRAEPPRPKPIPRRPVEKVEAPPEPKAPPQVKAQPRVPAQPDLSLLLAQHLLLRRNMEESLLLLM